MTACFDKLDATSSAAAKAALENASKDREMTRILRSITARENLLARKDGQFVAVDVHSNADVGVMLDKREELEKALGMPIKTNDKQERVVSPIAPPKFPAKP